MRDAKPSRDQGGLRLSASLNPLKSFQSKPFARAYRISAWSHGRARLPLGTADTTQRLPEAELNGPWSFGLAEKDGTEARQKPSRAKGQRAVPHTVPNMYKIPAVPTVYLVLWNDGVHLGAKRGRSDVDSATRDTMKHLNEHNYRHGMQEVHQTLLAVFGLSEQLWDVDATHKAWIKDTVGHALSGQDVKTRLDGCELCDRTDRQQTDGQTCSSSIRLCNTPRLLLLNWWKPWEGMAWANGRTGQDQKKKKKGGRRQTKGKWSKSWKGPIKYQTQWTNPEV